MLSTQNILSLDQGKLFPKPRNEDEYYARFAGRADVAGESAKTRQWTLWDVAFLAFRPNPGK